MQENKDVYSYHTFIFPFMWKMNDDKKKNDKKKNDKKKNEYDEFVKYFEENKYWDDTNWKDSTTIPDSMQYELLTLYKEYQFFFPYVRKSLYGYDGGIVRNFSFKPVQNSTNATYTIIKTKEGKEFRYDLDITSIQLKIYKTGVALFIMQCKYDKKVQTKKYDEDKNIWIEQEEYTVSHFEAVKNINDYGRRIFAPFISTVSKEKLKAKIQKENGNKEKSDDELEKICENRMPIERISNAITADKLSINIDFKDDEANANAEANDKANAEVKKIHTEIDFAKFYENANKPERCKDISLTSDSYESRNLITGILGYRDKGDEEYYTFDTKPSKDKIYIYPAMDDRMFVMSAVSDASQVSRMTAPPKSFGKSTEYLFMEDETMQKSLYELAYVDNAGGCTCQDTEMRKEYLEKCVYKRWIGYGSIYTVTYQGVNMLTTVDPKDDDIRLFESFLTEYFQILCLCLAQRASIIKFNNRVEECSGEMATTGTNSELTRELIKIQEEFVSFQGQLCFDEISSEEQPIELYAMMKKALFIEEELATVQNRISALYETANTSSGNKINASGNTLNIIATVFAVVSVGLSIAAMIFNIVSVSDVVYFEGDISQKIHKSERFIIICTVITVAVAVGTPLIKIKWEDIKNFFRRKK
jgi:hypothetical protein